MPLEPLPGVAINATLVIALADFCQQPELPAQRAACAGDQIYAGQLAMSCARAVLADTSGNLVRGLAGIVHAGQAASGSALAVVWFCRSPAAVCGYSAKAARPGCRARPKRLCWND